MTHLLNNIYQFIMVTVFSFLILGCERETPIKIIDKQLENASDDRYSISYQSCRPLSYKNGNNEIRLPKLNKGFYLYYANSKDDLPRFNYIDNREGINVITDLPITKVKNIRYSTEGEYLIESENGFFYVEKDIKGKVIVKKEQKSLKRKSEFLKFEPIKWNNEFIHNWLNMYFGIDDRHLPNYQPGSTPKITCIKNISIYFLDNDSNVRKYYLIGETEYEYFLFDVSSGDVKYIIYDDFIKTLRYAHKKYGGPQFVGSPGFYLNVKDLNWNP